MKTILIVSLFLLVGCGKQFQIPENANAADSAPTPEKVRESVTKSLACLSLDAAPDEGNVDLEIKGTTKDGIWEGVSCKIIDHDEGDTMGEAIGETSCEVPLVFLINDTTPITIGRFQITFNESGYADVAYRTVTSNTWKNRDFQVKAEDCEIQ